MTATEDLTSMNQVTSAGTSEGRQELQLRKDVSEKEELFYKAFAKYFLRHPKDSKIMRERICLRRSASRSVNFALLID